MKPLLALAALLLLGACAASPRNRLVWVELGGSGPCIVRLDRRPFTLPADEAGLVARSARLAALHPGALVSGAQGLSFACYRIGMAVIERARFRRVGFVSDFQPEG